ncbi:BatD family protein [Mariniblastus sp.]|nr:BatD family protein [Mariniblastus sp.]
MQRFIEKNRSECGVVDSTAHPNRKRTRIGQSSKTQVRTAARHWLSKTRLAVAIVVVAVSLGLNSPTVSADVQTQISAREAYVGTPITLYVQVSGTGNPATPDVPEVDGLDIRSVGAPSRSSQVTIINGRRSQSSSVTYSFQVTPRREGTFRIPSFEINTGSDVERTRPVRFAATKSETGDLMFAEIEGNGEKVFVGQPIDSKLKIWIKPFVDRTAGIKLSPSQMWQLMSEQTDWGGFQSTLEEMAKNRQAVQGREVLREDNDGIERAYYLFEIDATIYPKSAGVLDSENVQIVYQYPLEIGRSRDPFDSFFGGSPFGGSSRGSSLASQFFGGNSAFGGRSPFGRSLTVTNARPVTVEPSVSNVEIAPIPTDGRPDDYRGAVGQYAIVTQASPTQVKAGDPITLQIGIRGTGPMELVQAPPLHAIASLTSDFKVADEALAGVVQDDIKFFSTTIRPRHEGVTAIPSIPFSYFDPTQEQFVTVQSDPISIKVDKADTLALDAIVGSGRSSNERDSASLAPDSAPSFLLENDNSNSILSQSGSGDSASLWWLAIFPPAIWLGMLFWNRRDGFSVSRGKCLREIKQSQSATALGDFVQRALESGDANTNSLQRRVSEDYPIELKNRIRTFYADCDREAYAGSSNTLGRLKAQAKQIVRDLPEPNRTRWQAVALERPMQKLASAGLIAVLAIAAAFTFVESGGQSHPSSIAQTTATLTLDRQQQEQILEEASIAYERGLSLAESDAAEAKLAFATAAEKYQVLIDSGIHNASLYTNFGNASLQQDDIGNAVASFEAARRTDPGFAKATHNLELVKQRMASSNLVASHAGFWNTIGLKATSSIPVWFGWTLFGAAWLAFWSVLATSLWRPIAFGNWDRPLVGASAALVLIACGWIVAQNQALDTMRTPIAVVTDVAAEVKTGAGNEFDTASGFELNEGTAWRLLQQQGDWCQVESESGATGWVKNSDVEVVPSV